MSLSAKVRRIYDRRPYPFGDDRALSCASWDLDVAWLETLGPSDSLARDRPRILVAGCGDGAEAFALRRTFPRSEIVGVDFSRRSIAIARRLQRKVGIMRDIRFVAGDLAGPGQPDRWGGKFDLIVCHGVLSYVARPSHALRNFARALAPAGILYLGVNGAAHLSRRLRRVLPALGFDLETFRDGGPARAALRLCDAALEGSGFPKISDHSAELISSDVFGVLNRCLPLAGWVAKARAAGLSPRGNWAAFSSLRRIAEAGATGLLMPRNRAQAAAFLERLAPSQFHRLLFSLEPEPSPPWERREALLQWRPGRTPFHRLRLPKLSRPVRDRLVAVRITSPGLNQAMEWKMPEWEVAVLRGADGRQALSALLEAIPLAIPFPDLQVQLYLLFQLGIINLIPPGPTV